MGGEGSMSYAILSLKNNRALLKKRKFRDLKDVLYAQSGKTEIEFKDISSAEMMSLKNQIRLQAKRDAQIQILINVLAVVLSIGLIYLVYWFFKSL